MLTLPVTAATTVVLVRPHYPENLGAAVRACKTMGITRVVLVKPGRLARPDHEMARKMAVKSWDVLEQIQLVDTVAEAIAHCSLTFATTSRRGASGVLQPRAAAEAANQAALAGNTVGLLFGNEKTGLADEDRELCQQMLRIPIAADQPSINLAQAVQIIAYEFFLAGLAHRNRSQSINGHSVNEHSVNEHSDEQEEV